MSKATDQAFFDGYQAAMRDIRSALAVDGESGVRRWVADNLRPEPTPIDEPLSGVELDGVRLYSTADEAYEAAMADEAGRSYPHSDCRYCRRYGRACGRHSEPESTEPAATWSTHDFDEAALPPEFAAEYDEEPNVIDRIIYGADAQ